MDQMPQILTGWHVSSARRCRHLVWQQPLWCVGWCLQPAQVWLEKASDSNYLVFDSVMKELMECIRDSVRDHCGQEAVTFVIDCHSAGCGTCDVRDQLWWWVCKDWIHVVISPFARVLRTSTGIFFAELCCSPELPCHSLGCMDVGCGFMYITYCFISSLMGSAGTAESRNWLLRTQRGQLWRTTWQQEQWLAAALRRLMLTKSGGWKAAVNQGTWRGSQCQPIRMPTCVQRLKSCSVCSHSSTSIGCRTRLHCLLAVWHITGTPYKSAGECPIVAVLLSLVRKHEHWKLFLFLLICLLTEISSQWRTVSVASCQDAMKEGRGSLRDSMTRTTMAVKMASAVSCDFCSFAACELESRWQRLEPGCLCFFAVYLAHQQCLARPDLEQEFKKVQPHSCRKFQRPPGAHIAGPLPWHIWPSTRQRTKSAGSELLTVSDITVTLSFRKSFLQQMAPLPAMDLHLYDRLHWFQNHTQAGVLREGLGGQILRQCEAAEFATTTVVKMLGPAMKEVDCQLESREHEGQNWYQQDLIAALYRSLIKNMHPGVCVVVATKSYFRRTNRFPKSPV